MEIDAVLALRQLLERTPRYALYGSGKCGQELLRLIRDFAMPMPVCIMDDSPKCSALLGVPVRPSGSAQADEIDAVLLGSDVHQVRMRDRIEEFFGKEMKVLDILEPVCAGSEARTLAKLRIADIQATETLFRMSRRFPHGGQKVKIHFLVQRESLWPSWQSFWIACAADPRVEAKMIVCPEGYGEGDDASFDCSRKIDFLTGFGIQALSVEAYDITAESPHVMVLQNPYDFATRPAWLRADSLKARGIRVVYISYGLESDKAKEDGGNLDRMHYGLNTHVHAWRIFTCSEHVKAGYARLCPVGDKHVRVLGHPKFDGLYDLSKFRLPEATVAKIGGRRVVVWQLHFPVNYIGGGVAGWHTLSFGRNVEILNYLQGQDDIFLLLTHHPLFKARSVLKGAATEGEIDRFLAQASGGRNSALFDGPDYRCALAVGDAFISEISSLLIEMIATQAPVLHLQDIPVLFNQFGGGITSAYYHGTGVDDVRGFVEMLRRGEDPKATERRKALKQYVPFFDGKAGERIKEHIVSELLRGAS